MKNKTTTGAGRHSQNARRQTAAFTLIELLVALHHCRAGGVAAACLAKAKEQGQTH